MWRLSDNPGWLKHGKFLVDANSDVKAFWDSFDSFFSDNEYFKSLELGWTSGQGRIYLDNYHVTFWHKDEREEAGKPSGWGVNLSFARFVDDRWMPFLRGGKPSAMIQLRWRKPPSCPPRKAYWPGLNRVRLDLHWSWFC